MNDNDGNQVGTGTYDIIGLMYNQPWNYYNQGGYIPTEVGVSINIIPEPSSFILLIIGFSILPRRKKG